MKRFILLSVAVMSYAISSAQIQWNPQWVPGSTQTLEYVYSKIQHQKDTLKSFDSVNATLQSKYVGKVGDDHFFQWTYTRYWIDTTKGSAKDKLSNMVAANTLMRCPIKFVLKGRSYEVTLLNETEIDSVADLVAGEVVRTLGNNKNTEDMEMAKAMLKLMLALGKDKLFYGQLHDFYSVYHMKNLKPGVKVDVKDMADEESKKMMDGFRGYALLDDTDPKQYQWTFDKRMDMSAIFTAFAELAKAMKDTSSSETSSKGKKGKKEKPKEEPKEELKMPESTGGMVSNTRILISKPDMLVTYYYDYAATDGDMLGLGITEKEMKLVREVK